MKIFLRERGNVISVSPHYVILMLFKNGIDHFCFFSEKTNKKKKAAARKFRMQLV